MFSCQALKCFWGACIVVLKYTTTLGHLSGFILHPCVRYLLSREGLGAAKLLVAWLFNLAFSVALVFAATWPVVAVAPEAAGAGVAEVMAYLNGCNLPRVRPCCMRCMRASAHIPGHPVRLTSRAVPLRAHAPTLAAHSESEMAAIGRQGVLPGSHSLGV